ncbi:MAG: M14 family metallopeptidase [Gammaproteobacteria bacterium]|nr:MAG: M14 family metallopeptidase [Gammaproteobacteria bacterium]
MGARALLGVLGTLGAALATAAPAPVTPAEASGFTATARHAEVMAFIRELQRASPRVRLERLGVSAEGRDIPLLVIGAPPPTAPGDLRRDPRAVVYFQANIHAGEVEGKDAALMVARELSLGEASKYLDRLVVLIAPIFNPDGNEQVSTTNRPAQKGPAGGVGVRVNGQNLDLNRDGVKLETPEVRGLVENVLQRWDPVFFLDAHTHNGSYHQEPVTWVWGLHPNGAATIFDYMAGQVWPAIERQMRERHGMLTIPHGDFLDPRDPARGWVPLGPEPRYLSNYVGLRNRLAVLDEQYPYVDFETRVAGARALMLSFLEYLHRHRDEVVALVREADRATIARGLNPGERDVFAIGTEPAALARRLTIQGYEMTVEDTGRRYPKVTPSAVKRTYGNVPYLAKYAPTRTVRLPRGYLITARSPEVIGKLREHGIVVERLAEEATATVEAFSVQKLAGASFPDQGHYTSTVQGSYADKTMTFAPGTHFVSMAQPLANVAAQLLEPESPDGLVTWNFFDRYIAFQWIPQPMEYPVYRLHEDARLVTVAL